MKDKRIWKTKDFLYKPRKYKRWLESNSLGKNGRQIRQRNCRWKQARRTKDTFRNVDTFRKLDSIYTYITYILYKFYLCT